MSRLTDSLAFGALARCGWFAMPEENENGDTGRKLFLKGKNNLARDTGGLAYSIGERDIGGGITAPYVKWGEPVAITADHALATVGVKPSAADVAETFLDDLLGERASLCGYHPRVRRGERP